MKKITKDLEELKEVLKKEKKVSKVKEKTLIHVEAPNPGERSKIITIPKGLKIFR